MVSNGPIAKDQNFLDPRLEIRRKRSDTSSVNFRDTFVTFKPSNGRVNTGVSTPVASLHPPPSTQTFSSLATLQSDRFSSNTTLSSIWDIEVEPCHPGQNLSGPPETRSRPQEEKKAPIVKFRRSPGGGGQRSSLKHCSKLTKARDISSCEISICGTASPPPLGTKRHVSVSFGSLPSSCSEASSEAEDRIEVAKTSGLSPCDPCPELLRLPRPSLVIQQSTDSTDTATTTTENTQLPRRMQINRQTSGLVVLWLIVTDTSQMPIATALFVATCLGTPAIALTGLKLGMFAAVGGGIMGFATGKMFAEHEDRQALIKGDFNDGRVPTHIKRQKTMKRIQEWEKFEESCHMLKEMDDEQIVKISELQKERRGRAGSLGALREVKVNKNLSNLRKAKSVSNSHQLSP